VPIILLYAIHKGGKMIIAVDPGASGGIAVLHDGAVEVRPMPETIGDLVTAFIDTIQKRDAGDPCVVYVEQLSGFAGGVGNPGARMFVMGKYYWPFEALCFAFDIRLQYVTPQKWQGSFGLGKRGSSKGNGKNEFARMKREWKGKLKAEAQRTFPMVQKVTLETADALMILEYARRVELAGEVTAPF
jgi:hypothetical protein